MATGGIQCAENHTPCPPGQYDRYCSGNGVCCINTAVRPQPFCRCYEDFAGDQCQMSKAQEDIMLELKEEYRMATSALISSLFIAGLLVIFAVGVIVFVVVKRRRKARHPSPPRNRPTAFAGTEMTSLSPPTPKEPPPYLGDEVVDRLLLESEVGNGEAGVLMCNGVAGGALYPTSPPKSPKPSNGLSPLPGYSWREGSMRRCHPLQSVEKSQSRSTPSCIDKIDLNSNGVVGDGSTVAKGNYANGRDGSTVAKGNNANGNIVVDDVFSR